MLVVTDPRVTVAALDPFQKCLAIPCWLPFMWETILSYGSEYNTQVLKEIDRLKFYCEHGYWYDVGRGGL